jgi:hypothetical protein
VTGFVVTSAELRAAQSFVSDDLVQNWRSFLAAPDGYLRHLH